MYRCINDNDDKINQQYIRIIINITRYIYRYIYVYRYRPCHRMLIAKDQPCSACIVKHGFSNQTGFVRHSSRSDRAPCKRTVKTYKRTRTTRRCVVEILWRIIWSRILISIVSIWIVMIFFPPRFLSLCRLESVVYAISRMSSIFLTPSPLNVKSVSCLSVSTLLLSLFSRT